MKCLVGGLGRNAQADCSIGSMAIVCVHMSLSGALRPGAENDKFTYEERMARARHPLRDWVVGMFRNGTLTSPAEGAIVATVPRQTVGRWIREAGIDVKAARLQFLARSQRRAQRYVEGKPPRGKPSKRYLRRLAAKALRDFNRAQSKRVAETAGRDPG